MKHDFDLAVGQIACAETALQYLKAICKNEDLYTDLDARRCIRHVRLTIDKVERILFEPMRDEDEQPQLQQTDVVRSDNVGEDDYYSKNSISSVSGVGIQKP